MRTGPVTLAEGLFGREQNNTRCISYAVDNGFRRTYTAPDYSQLREMRVIVTSSLLVATLLLVPPADAQLRTAATNGTSPVQLYDGGSSGFLMNTLFNPKHFRMGHSFEMSAMTGGGFSSSLAMYTNSLMWRFSDDLSARADVSIAYSPFSSGFNSAGSLSQSSPRVFLRNAEINYRPLSNMNIHLSVRQSPYGYYVSPYGYYPRYRYR